MNKFGKFLGIVLILLAVMNFLTDDCAMAFIELVFGVGILSLERNEKL